jgi:hypothetical protein
VPVNPKEERGKNVNSRRAGVDGVSEMGVLRRGDGMRGVMQRG